MTTPVGILNVNKPAGMTSRDVVNHVQRLIRPAKVGHAGTLDPLATGVLILCLGSATRLIQYVQRRPKRYAATFLFGCRSDTEDVTGQVEQLAAPPIPTREQITAAARTFIGEIQQRPPAYSAIKVAGRRAYQKARRGEPVELAPRRITVHGIDLIDYRYPELKVNITCGSGTYVRSLGRDLAESLGTAAVMSQLTRTAIGEFTLEDACVLAQLTNENLTSFLQPAARAVGGLPRVKLSDEQVARVSNGQTIEVTEDVAGDEIAALDLSDRLIAILRPSGPGQFTPVLVLR